LNWEEKENPTSPQQQKGGKDVGIVLFAEGEKEKVQIQVNVFLWVEERDPIERSTFNASRKRGKSAP